MKTEKGFPSLGRYISIKQFLSLFFLTLFLVLTAHSNAIAGITSTTKEGPLQVKLIKEMIARNFMSVVSDLMFLSEQNNLKKIVNKRYSRNALEELASEYLLFCDAKGESYSQLSFIDEHGMEKVKVVYKDGYPTIISYDNLQSKKSHLPFKRAHLFNKGNIYISPEEGNMNSQEIVFPLRQIIHFAIPVYNSKGKNRGLIVLKYNIVDLLEYIDEMINTTDSAFVLLRSDGALFSNPESADKWNVFVDAKKGPLFKNIFSKIWQSVLAKKSGQSYTKKGIISFDTLYFIESDQHSQEIQFVETKLVDTVSPKKLSWKIVHYSDFSTKTSERLK